MKTNKIKLIIAREYISRVKKKSFIIMTLLAPVLMAAIVAIPIIANQLNKEETKVIAVVDGTQKYKEAFQGDETVKYEYFTDKNKSKELIQKLADSEYYGVLSINDSSAEHPELVAKEQVGLGIKSKIINDLKQEEQKQRMLKFNISEEQLEAIKPHIKLNTSVWKEGKKEKSSTEIAMAFGIIMGLIIYMITLIYGSFVMRSVLEEKTSRVVEVLISSVKPFELMMGKVVGVALVALTQFTIWIVLTIGILGVGQQFFPQLKDAKNISTVQTQNMNNEQVQEAIQAANPEIANIFEAINNLPLGEMVFALIFFFIGGYLLYSSLFAAIGAAVDNETDSQQFVLPITLPLILAMVMLQSIIENPHGVVAYWFSIIPFTSPIVMLMRIPFGVPVFDLVLSSVLLVLTFIGTIWLAGKIYRTGILMYGKKVNYKELWKWIRYR